MISVDVAATSRSETAMNKLCVAACAAALVLLPTSVAHAQPLEDEPGYSCVDQGNRVCGPGNSNHAPAGCYDDGGVLFASWPCKPWTPLDGYRHGDGSITYPPEVTWGYQPPLDKGDDK